MRATLLVAGNSIISNETSNSSGELLLTFKFNYDFHVERFAVLNKQRLLWNLLDLESRKSCRANHKMGQPGRENLGQIDGKLWENQENLRKTRKTSKTRKTGDKF